MSQSFTQKSIRVTIILGEDTFSEDNNTKDYEGFPCSVTIRKPGLPEKNTCSIKLYGLTHEDMTRLTMLAFRPLETHRNIIQVWAGQAGSPLSMAFAGEITRASADFNTAPDVEMHFEASSGYYPQLIPAPTQTVQGEAPAAQLFEQFTREAGYVFRNKGVTASVKNAWFPGSPIDKMRKLARDINCELIIDDGTVIVMPAGQAREDSAILLNKASGLIGYPSPTQDGVVCRCLYNPELEYGGLIRTDSNAPRLSGLWRIINLTHKLSANLPKDGPWETEVEAAFYE